MLITDFRLNKDKFFSISIFIFVLVCYSVLFYLSTKFIINDWTWSQAHTNYSYGYVKRGLFGSLILYLENNFNIKTVDSFTNFFICLKLSNIILFFLLISQYYKNKIFFLFLALNPLLIMFAFNDLGGYQRFDDLSIFLILIHSLILRMFYNNEVSLKFYSKFLYFIILPLIFISMLIHEIVVWSLPFHFFMTANIYKKIFNIGVFAYLILLILTIFIFLYPVPDSTFSSMFNDLAGKNLSYEPIKVSSQTKNNIAIINDQIKINILTGYNFIVNIFFLALGTFPFYFLLKKFKKNNEILLKELKPNFFILSILPYLSFFIIGDTGRWLSLISFTSLAILGQYNYTYNSKKKLKNKFLKLLIIISVVILCFFIQVPHLIKQVPIYGGIFEKTIDGYNLFILRNNDDFYNLNKRFKKNP